MSSQDDVVPGSRVPAGGEPGAGSTPADAGEGVVDVGDRTDEGAPAANQSKAEPLPPSGDAASGAGEPPDLGSMNVGAADPQAPSHPAAAAPGDRAQAGLPASDAPVAGHGPRPAEDLGAPTLEAPTAEPGTAFRAPGSMGATAAGEEVDTDVDASAARTNVVGAAGAPSGPGDAADVPVASADAAPGSSQDSSQVQGSRTPR